MKLSIGQVAKRIGISVRTLHYYDEIGLLHPKGRSESGYRYYNRESLLRLQQILFFRELGFELAQIAEILSKPNYNPIQALKQQRKLLQMKRERLDALIAVSYTHLDVYKRQVDNIAVNDSRTGNFKVACGRDVYKRQDETHVDESTRQNQKGKIERRLRCHFICDSKRYNKKPPERSGGFYP